MKNIIHIIREEINDVIHQFNPHKYNSFSELSEQDLYDIAKWGLLNDFNSSGAWDCAKDINDIEAAIKCAVEGFENLLNDNFPDGFNGIPDVVTAYRMIKLDNPNNFNSKNVGYSWFTNPNRINDPYFKQQMWHLRTPNLYLITAKIPESNIDIPRSLFQRDMVWAENEIVLKNDSDVNIESLKKL